MDQANQILAFRGEYAFLSNFHPSPLDYESVTFKTVEAAFQAAKTFDLSLRREIAALATPTAAKRLGREIPIRPDWESVKIDVMEEILFLKFTQNAVLGEKLLATGNVHLEEGNTNSDATWGTVNGIGTNYLGFALMRVRDRIRGVIDDPSGFKVKRRKRHL